MTRHPFDPVSAVLGILAAVAGLVVALGEAAHLDTAGSWWVVAAALLVGLALLPWRRRNPAPADAATERADEA